MYSRIYYSRTLCSTAYVEIVTPVSASHMEEVFIYTKNLSFILGKMYARNLADRFLQHINVNVHLQLNGNPKNEAMRLSCDTGRDWLECESFRSVK